MSKRKFCWMYYDVVLDQIVKVKRPRRNVVEPKMTVYSTDAEGNLQDFYTHTICGFSQRFVYLGGINHGAPRE